MSTTERRTGRLPGATVAEKLALNWVPDGECQRWTGAHIRTGYGQISIDGKRRAVHRVAYEIHNGPIPDGYEIDHRCSTRDCIRIDHLEAVTHLENVRRGNSPAMVDSRRATCRNGHPKTPENRRPYTDRRGKPRTRCRACYNASRRASRRSNRRA